jgi:hypothetical protein
VRLAAEVLPPDLVTALMTPPRAPPYSARCTPGLDLHFLQVLEHGVLARVAVAGWLFVATPVVVNGVSAALAPIETCRPALELSGVDAGRPSSASTWSCAPLASRFELLGP